MSRPKGAAARRKEIAALVRERFGPIPLRELRPIPLAKPQPPQRQIVRVEDPILVTRRRCRDLLEACEPIHETRRAA